MVPQEDENERRCLNTLQTNLTGSLARTWYARQPNGSYKDGHDLIPLSAPAKSLNSFAKIVRKLCARLPSKKPRTCAILKKLGKTRDRRGNLANKLVSGLFADAGEDLPPYSLHLAHVEA